MQAHYLFLMEDKKAEELQKFIHILNTIFSSFFQESEETIVTRRQADLRAPVKLTPKEDITKLRNYNRKVIEDMASYPYSVRSPNSFCLLRDALVYRLTLYNGRRIGEASRMTPAEFNDTIDDKWVDERIVQNLTETEKV